jgi:hypothetical protein
MRGAIVLAACLATGCLEAPEGRPQTWPLADTPTISALVAADFDGDGATDLIAVATGLASDGGGVYLLRGGVDVTVPAATPIGSFSRVALLDLGAPIAALAVELDGGGPGLDLLLAHGADGTVQLVGLRGDDLSILGNTAVDVPAPPADAPIWLDTIAFHTSQARVVVAVGDNLRHLPLAGLLDDPGDAMFPPPSGEARWTHPDAIATFEAPDTIIAIAAEDTTWTGPLPAGEPPEFVWTAARPDAPWVGQSLLDLTGDGVPEVIGFSTEGAAPGKLCVLEVVTATTSCIDTTIGADTVEVRLARLTPDTMPDVVVIERGADAAHLTVFPNLVFDGTTATASPGLAPLDVAVPDALDAPFPIDAGHDALLLVGSDGSQACTTLGQQSFGTCD